MQLTNLISGSNIWLGIDLAKPMHTMWSLAGQTYVYYHFTTLTGPDLAEQLQDEGFCHIPGKIPHVPRQKKTRGTIKQGNYIANYVFLVFVLF